ncbi:hypothetical protein [Microbacterium indicum]|uniref:hypothetical protein n=1 Tax=Microbacterium indicum TaxID=358100 RepID=UPI000417CD4A|nr:hypothetical protein [Microbacterium indicum]
MTGFLDALVWLATFPATHGYEMVFVGAFGGIGLIAMAFRGGSGSSGSRLADLRRERGLQAPAAAGASATFVFVRWLWRILALVVLSGAVIGLISLISSPITSPYIYANGAMAVAVDNGDDTLTFTAEDGAEYTVNVPFFTQPSYPDADAFLAMSEQVVVRYLPDHPQAFVVDTDETLDSWGESIGD